MAKPRILIYDLETAPDLGHSWRKWDTNLLDFHSNWYMLSFAWKWLGERKTYVLGLDDYNGYQADMQNDYSLTEDLWMLFDQADITVAHNGRAFDKGKAQARFIYHNMEPPSPTKDIDTFLIAKKEFRFTSNSLKDLAQYLKLETQKGDPGTFQTWLNCMAGDPKAWKLMKKYNRQDVVVLEQLYLRLRPWTTGHPNMALFDDNHPDACPKCGVSGQMQGRGWRYYSVTRRQRFQCQACGGYSLGRILEKTKVLYVAN